MYRWCAYCQRYLGEKPPLHDYAMTHGICASCASRGSLPDEEALARHQPIRDFYRDLIEVARRSEPLPVRSAIERGVALGVRPPDLLFGLLQPALYEVGRRWERAEMTPQQEAAFSSFCGAVLDELTREQALRLPPPGGERVVLMNAEWNRHTLGLRMAAFLLRERGFEVHLLMPTPSLDQLPGALSSLRPRVVGVSLATDWQLPFLDRVVEIARTLAPAPRVVAGGAVVREGVGLPEGVEGWAWFEQQTGT